MVLAGTGAGGPAPTCSLLGLRRKTRQPKSGHGAGVGLGAPLPDSHLLSLCLSYLLSLSLTFSFSFTSSLSYPLSCLSVSPHPGLTSSLISSLSVSPPASWLTSPLTSFSSSSVYCLPTNSQLLSPQHRLVPGAHPREFGVCLTRKPFAPTPHLAPKGSVGEAVSLSQEEESVTQTLQPPCGQRTSPWHHHRTATPPVTPAEPQPAPAWSGSQAWGNRPGKSAGLGGAGGSSVPLLFFPSQQHWNGGHHIPGG